MDAGAPLSNPELQFRLEPGEPGYLRNQPASRSSFNVASQEQRKLNRQRSEKLRDGQRITKADITYKLRRRGSFITIVGGNTTVEAEESANTLPAPQITSPPPPKTNPADYNTVADDNRGSRMASTANLDSDRPPVGANGQQTTTPAPNIAGRHIDLTA